MVIFNFVALLDLLLTLGLCFLVSLFLSDFGSLESMKLGGVGVANLTFAICLFVVSSLTEVAGLRGRLFFIPTVAFGAFYLGYQLSHRIGVFGWVVGGVLGAGVLAFSFFVRSGTEEEAEATDKAEPTP